MQHTVQVPTKVKVSFSLWVKEVSALLHKELQPVTFLVPLPPWHARCIQEGSVWYPELFVSLVQPLFLTPVMQAVVVHPIPQLLACLSRFLTGSSSRNICSSGIWAL